MFGRNGGKAQPTRPAIAASGRVSGNIETDSLVISQGGFFNGNVAKIGERDAMAGSRPVHLVEDKRVGAQK